MVPRYEESLKPVVVSYICLQVYIASRRKDVVQKVADEWRSQGPGTIIAYV